MRYKTRKIVCDHCELGATVRVTSNDGTLSTNLCPGHVPVPVAGDTLETMYDRYFKELEPRAGVCSISLCGRDSDEMWGDAPICREHHEMMVEIQAVKEEENVKRQHKEKESSILT